MTQTGMWLTERPAGHWWGWGGEAGVEGGAGDHTAGRASQLAEVMDSWLHLRKWHGLDLLSEMHGSICLHSSQ